MFINIRIGKGWANSLSRDSYDGEVSNKYWN